MKNSEKNTRVSQTTSLKPGRKHKGESRATEIRARLVQWRETPEPTRISLRALGAEIGTSHQLLSFYLRDLDKWLEAEYMRAARAIRARANAENRSMTKEESEREMAYRSISGKYMAGSILGKILRDCEANARRGQLSAMDHFAVDLLAKRGIPMASKIQRMAQKIKPKGTRLDAVLKELENTTDSEKAARLIRQLTPEERKEVYALQEGRKRIRIDQN